MPHEGLSKQVWNDRLKQYAAGTYAFGQGNHPPSDSPWAAKIHKIKNCPAHKSRGQSTLFGGRVSCRCGFHPKKATPKKKVSTDMYRFSSCGFVIIVSD